MIRPDKNINGSGKENLLRDKSLEIEKISELIDLLVKNFPHARDYQIAGFYWDDASREQAKRIDVLSNILQEMQKEQEYLAD